MTKMKKLSLALAALALTGSLAGPVSALTNADLQQIRSFVENDDDQGLRAFLLENLSALDGSPIGVMLREYVQTPPEETIFVSLGSRVQCQRRCGILLNKQKQTPHCTSSWPPSTSNR